MTNIRTKPEGSETSVLAILKKTTFRNLWVDGDRFDRPQELDIDFLVKQFQAVLDEEVQSTFDSWAQSYQRKIDQYVDLLERYAKKLAQLQQASVVPADAARQEFRLFLTAIYEWTAKLAPEYFLPHPWHALSETFMHELETVPETFEIPVSPGYWAIHQDDSLRLRIWKQRSRFEFTIKRLARTIILQMKQLGGASSPSSVDVHQYVHLHSFLTHYLESPVAEYLIKEWLQLLKYVAKQLYTLHLEAIEMKYVFQFLYELEAPPDSMDAQQLDTACKRLNHHLSTARSLLQGLDQFGAEAWQRFGADKGEIYRNLAEKGLFSDIHKLLSMANDAQQAHKSRAQLNAQLETDLENWRHHFQAEQGEWQAGLELSLLQLNIVQIYRETQGNIVDTIRRQLIPGISDTASSVVDLAQQVSDLKYGDSQTIKLATTEIRELLEALQQESIPSMMDTLIRSRLDSLANHFSLRIRDAIEILSAEHKIFIKRDLANPVPKSVTNDTHFLKAIVLENLYVTFQQEHQFFNVEYQHRIETIIRIISEIDQIAEVALEAALQPLKGQISADDFEEARHHVLNWLAQITEDINELTRQIEYLLEESEKQLLKLTNGFVEQLLTLAGTDSEGQIEKYLLMARATAGEKLWNYRRKILTAMKATLPTIVEGVSARINQVQRNYFRLREMTGLAPDNTDAAESLVRFLTETEEHINMLPYVYQRLFQLAPLNDDRFFSTRKAELDLLSQAYESWQGGLFAATALVGERGSGVTTLLNLAKQQIYKDYPIIEMDFLNARSIFTDEALFAFLRTAFREITFDHDPADMDELEESIKALTQPRVVIAEDLQHVFLRTTYGFDALERLLLFIGRTYQNLHWVLTCSLYSWDYFEKVIKINEYVQQKIVFKALGQEDIEEIILMRHQASGYQLVFEPTPDIIQSRRFKKLKTEQERQESLQTQFFQQLTELAAGNISVAMLFWLRSYKEFSEDKLILPATIHFDPSFLYQLPAEELFALAALLQHDILSTEDHALICHQDVQQSQMLLNRMANKGFLVQQKYGYRIHPFLYRPVVQVLKSDNIIH